MKLENLSTVEKNNFFQKAKSALNVDGINFASSEKLQHLNAIASMVEAMKHNLQVINSLDLDKSLETFNKVLNPLQLEEEKADNIRIQNKFNKAEENAKSRIDAISSFLKKDDLYSVTGSTMVDSKKTRQIPNNSYYYTYSKDFIVLSKEKTDSKNQFHVFCELSMKYADIIAVTNIFACKILDSFSLSYQSHIDFVTDYVPILIDSKFVKLKENEISEIQKRAICKELAKFERRIVKLADKNTKFNKDFRNYHGISPFKDALQNATMLE